jgi:hypothetical protein
VVVVVVVVVVVGEAVNAGTTITMARDTIRIIGGKLTI